MTRRLLISYLTITLIVLLLLGVPLGVFYAQRERERLTADLDRDASVIATLYEDALEAGNPLDPTAADRYEDRTGARVVVVDADGQRLSDCPHPFVVGDASRDDVLHECGIGRAKTLLASLDTDAATRHVFGEALHTSADDLVRRIARQRLDGVDLGHQRVLRERLLDRTTARHTDDRREKEEDNHPTREVMTDHENLH